MTKNHDFCSPAPPSGLCLECERERLTEELRQSKLQVTEQQKNQYAAAIEFLKAEAKKIPLGQGDVEKGFSSTYNALIFCARELERAQTERRVDPQQNCDHKWAHIEDHHVICEKCKHVADLCWTCEAEKQDVGGVLVCLNCRGH